MENGYKCELVKESLELKVDFEEFDTIDCWDQTEDDYKSGEMKK